MNLSIRTRRSRRLAVVGAVGLALVATACGGEKDDLSSATTAAAATTAASATTAGGAATTEAPTATEAPTTAAEGTEAPADLEAELNGSGATFPKTFYEEAIAEFTDANDGVTINYAGGGSGKGRQDLADQIVDWAGTDSTIKDEDLPGFKGGEVLYFPTVVAPITVSYNLDVDGLQLSPETLAKIFQVQITNWNDPAIAADNPGVELPDQAITVVHRSDSSGTTSNFTKFLDKAAGADATGTWTLGADSTVEWDPNTQAGEGNSGVAQIVQSTAGAIGYVDLSDATDAGLQVAAVQNKAGNYVLPTIEAASAAAAGAEVKDNLTFSAVWADGDDAYPITAQTWIIVYAQQTDQAKADALKAFLQYVLTDGQALAPEVNFAPLPGELDDLALAQLDRITVG
ncbi:MAG: phosphate ABC transporter substrate-binding protein PstS [Acidimicrobiales bacterium]